MERGVWVFVANNASLPSGVFLDESTARGWIRLHSLSGVLTKYPLDVGIYEWAIENGFFSPKFPSQKTAEFVGRFTSAYLAHRHFENGTDEVLPENESGERTDRS